MPYELQSKYKKRSKFVNIRKWKQFKSVQVISTLRPITPVDEFEQACIKAKLNNKEQKIIDHIRYVGVFTQPSLTKDLKLDSKPPILSVLCEICRKIGKNMPEHY